MQQQWIVQDDLDCAKISPVRAAGQAAGGECLELRAGYRQVVLTLPEQLRIPFYNHRDQNRLYSRFMALAQACLEELVQDKFNSTDYKIASIVFLHTNGRNGSYNPHLHVTYFPHKPD